MTKYVVTDRWDKFGTYYDLEQALNDARGREYAVVAVIKDGKLCGEYRPHPDGFFGRFYFEGCVPTKKNGFYHFTF